MRQGFDAKLLRSPGGDLIGVSLGADFCSEHEWGIADTRCALGMSDDAFGLERRRIRNAEPVRWVEEGKFSGLWMPPPHSSNTKPNNVSAYKSDMWCGWSGSDFGAFGFTPKVSAALKKIYDAVKAGDGALWLGGGGVFQNAGLAVAIASALPAGTAEQWEKADRDAFELKRDAAATGIEERLRKAGKDFFALSPSRTKRGLLFWLNPMQQHENNHGWFTVEELDQWIAGKGPVPKKQTEKRR